MQFGEKESRNANEFERLNFIYMKLHNSHECSKILWSLTVKIKSYFEIR